MQKKWIFFAGIVVCLVVAGWGYYQYQKPRARAADVATAYKCTAEQLYNEYSTSEAAADKKYNGVVMEVTGLVADVQATAQSVNVLLAAGATGNGVNCSLQSKVNNLAVGRTVTIKGKCAGFLMDVSLVDAVVVSQ
jgi:predicted negative regulator of RcsB-dependent stress response